MEGQIECVEGLLDGKLKSFVGEQAYLPDIGLAEHIFNKREKIARGKMGVKGWHVYKYKDRKYYYIGIQQRDPE